MVKAKQSEEVRKQQRVIHPKELSGQNIDNLVQNKPRGPSRREETQHYHQQGSKFSRFADRAKCTRCLGNVHPRKFCQASESVCKMCSKKGHWVKACCSRENWGSSSEKVNEISQINSDEETYFWGTIGTSNKLIPSFQPESYYGGHAITN